MLIGPGGSHRLTPRVPGNIIQVNEGHYHSTYSGDGKFWGVTPQLPGASCSTIQVPVCGAGCGHGCTLASCGADITYVTDRTLPCGVNP